MHKNPNTPRGIDHATAGMATCSEPIRGASAAKHTRPPESAQTVEDLFKGRIEYLEGRLVRLRAAQLDAFLLNILDTPAHRFRRIANEL